MAFSLYRRLRGNNVAPSLLRGWLSAVVLLAANFTLFAQDEEDELQPGLSGTYTAGGVTIQRIDADLAFDFGGGTADPRLPAGPFTARWSGQILLREEGIYQFHAHLQGKLSVRINELMLLNAESDQPQWVSGTPAELPVGEQQIEIEYSATDGGRLWLAWSTGTFPLEPIPHHALFHSKLLSQISPAATAALAVSQHRCTRCHGDLPGMDSHPAPSLLQLGQDTSRDWLIDQIQHGGGEQGQMPRFQFTRDEAAAILDALLMDVKAVPLEDVPQSTEKELAAGRELLISVGCLACHQWEQTGRGGELSGPPLDRVGQRRSARWLNQWLKDPAKLNVNHQMPVFALTDAERRQIVAALTAQHTFPTVTAETPASPTLELGNRLIEGAQCARCHQLPGPKRPRAESPRWADMELAEEGCWSDRPSTQRRPFYSQLKIDELREFIRQARHQRERVTADVRGAQLLIQKGCVNCHDRDGRRGISSLAATLSQSHEQLQGRAPWLIPPQLTAVGDRLPDARLEKAIRGELPKRRLDWLLVRMPRYQHTDDEQAALLSHLVAHDRIPAPMPATPDYSLNGTREETLAGRELLGGKGFSCVACHPVKDFQPKQVALGTRGSNLFEIGDRLRSAYFFRWIRSPLRVMPGVEMPSYQRPHAVIFAGDLNRQLAAIWTALNDPALPTPVNPGAVEQYWTVKPGDPPRILRDVITLPGKKEQTVPRSFAVGFPNGHNVLFDLETASIRAWTIGDFSQQRTQGKSWFWDLVGTPVMVGAGPETDFVITMPEGKKAYFPSPDAEVRFLHAQQQHDKVALRYEISWPALAEQETRHGVEIEEILSAAADGWQRRIRLLHDDPEQAVIALRAFPAGARVDNFEFDLFRIEHDQRVEIERGEPRFIAFPSGEPIREVTLIYAAQSATETAPTPELPHFIALEEEVHAVPGFHGKRLPYPTNIMPTAMTFDRQGRLLFTSLKGHVYRGDDRSAEVFAEGLAAPFGILDSHDLLLVAHKPEIIGLVDRDGDGRADESTVIATGWGLTDDYHDWTCGLVRDAEGDLFTTLGSDYAQKGRPLEKSKWRGHALRIDTQGRIESLARGLRFPTGVAITSSQDIFITDQQGVQNTFNELNWLPSRSSSQTKSSEIRFGVPSLHDPEKDAPATPPAVQIPHPWTRSVNGIVAIPKSLADRTHPKLFDQLLGCEYDTRFLVRFSHQLVDGVMQGAVYPFSRNPGSSSNRDSLGHRTEDSRLVKARTGSQSRASAGLLGPLSIAISPDGDLFVGSIHDSGWQGGLNTGDIVKLSPTSEWKDGRWQNGLVEIRATPAGFDLEFFHAVEPKLAEQPGHYQIAGYTRIWQGSYATPDSGRHNVEVKSARLNAAGTVVSLTLDGLKPGFVYDVVIGDITPDGHALLWPNIGYYTLHNMPR